ncbi:hypothetical protein GCM10011316_22190 [Roseibium aquae]|uniref:Methyl-accepting transducer domain-containing protein n=1 Tax=Roseibium aquae TaxID=1323746 RepID=A0A916X1Y1_9HYPH|nr:methyl-accepting chemotaxis protein [Roseibium aquae]GGB49622.1 hypothetical protein GCM10011316_22190 [Roseibium aquae]
MAAQPASNGTKTSNIANTDTMQLGELLDFMLPKGGSEKSVKEAWHTIEPRLPEIMERFYDKMIATDALRAKMGDHAKKPDGLKKRQFSHWEYMFNNAPDLEFEGQAARIGQAHVRIGLDAEWLMAAFGRLLNEAVPVVMAHHRFSRSKATETVQALISRFFLDMILAQKAFEEADRLSKDNEQREVKNLESLKITANMVCDLNEIVMSVAQLSRNTQSASENGQSISAAADQLVASIEQISTNSEGAAQEADATTASAQDGLTKMQAVSQAMSDIAETSQKTSSSLSDLNEAAMQISEFLTVIETIANQTNLLALNATIEAARAGEAGKGFAVVASEVKALASQTSKATEDISQRIEALRSGMEMIQGSIANSQGAVQNGELAISSANEIMQSMEQQVSSVSARVRDITEILGQQKEASHEIARNVARVADLNQTNDECLHDVQGVLQKCNQQFAESAKMYFEADSDLSLVEIARIDHVLFKKRVVDTVTGLGNWASHEVPDHHTCRLGKWYDAIKSPQVRDLPVFKALVGPHERVHASAKAALAAHEASDPKTAFAALQELEAASKEVIQGLVQLHQTLRHGLVDHEQRQFSRRMAYGEARVETTDGSKSVDVHDISRTGMGVSGLEQAHVGRTMKVHFQGKEQLGEAVWSDGNRGGIRFLGNARGG